MINVAVGWQLYERTGDAWALGLVGVAELTPVLFLMVVAGNAADRYPRRNIGIFAHTVLTLAATGLALFQAVPLSPEGGGRVRLYFEAEGYDGRTRILHLDSRDGYIGRDFHAGPATRCSTLADYSAGGGCDPSLDIGVDVDGANGFPGIRNARQFKVAYPTRDSWAWDLAPGAFMWFTTEWPNGSCSTFGFNAAFAGLLRSCKG